MKKNKKPAYESPAIIELGELARGAGPGACKPVGSGATGQCGGGNTVPPTSCNPHGVQAGGCCDNGSGHKSPTTC